ncbi:MAG: hypothetical protein M3Y87_17675 [Myxococcota bacterium]|nr:hypothetical protein [Myxococcota bacterium]
MTRSTLAILVAFTLTSLTGCLLAEDGQCGPGSGPNEHACRAARAARRMPDIHVDRDAGSPRDASVPRVDARIECANPSVHQYGVGSLSGSSTASGSCGGGGPEAFFTFRAPHDGEYTFSTLAELDTVLYVRRGECAGPELACNDDFGSTRESQLTLWLSSGDAVEVVVDTYSSGASGDFELFVDF